jgi:hypothetical protein
VSYNPTYLVLFHSSNDVTPERVVQALEASSARVNRESNDFFRVTDNIWGVEARVYYSDADYVQQESQEIADEFAADRPDREFIAACDRRFEVIAEHNDDMLYFNNWLITTERLQGIVRGVVFDPVSGTFLNDPVRPPNG